jgi:hypothetical protein
MPVTKQVYTAAATWTASGLASIFRSAFIDAGLMTEWHAAFLSGSVENRVLEVVYDATKTYGRTYYWFQFTTAGAFIAVCTGWNGTSNIPAGPSDAGAQYLDWWSTTTNATTNHRTMLAMAATTSTTLTRYTSGINTAHSWFLLVHATTRLAFRIAGPAEVAPAWIDLDRIVRSDAQAVNVVTTSNLGIVHFTVISGSLRRTLIGSQALRGNTTLSNYRTIARLYSYAACGNVNNANSNTIPIVETSGFPTTAGMATVLPTAFNNTNPAFTTDKVPVFTGLAVSPYSNTVLPADFGLIPVYNNNTFGNQDLLIVSAGVEEWEAIDFANGASASTGTASMLFAARTT